MTFYARKGDRVVCSGPDRHHIATFMKDVDVGQFFDPDAVGEWQQMEAPKVGEKVPLCPACGAPLSYFHFEDGWRGRPAVDS